MKLLTKELERKFKAIGRQESNPDPVVIAKYFTPFSNWTWYATEYDSETRCFFGRVDGNESELGYFSLDEFEEYNAKRHVGIERDLYWTPKNLSEVR